MIHKQQVLQCQLLGSCMSRWGSIHGASSALVQGLLDSYPCRHKHRALLCLPVGTVNSKSMWCAETKLSICFVAAYAAVQKAEELRV